MPPTERPLRAVFFDAGNTLLQMNYTVIAAELMRHGVRVAPEKVGVWNTPDPQAHEALALVRRAGLRAAVISNSNGSVRSILDSLGLTTHLDFVLDSTEVGVEKPDPRIFELALTEARVVPGEAVYIGDLYSIDVRGARGSGMRAVLLDPGGHWGARDCPTAPDLMGAVSLVLGWR